MTGTDQSKLTVEVHGSNVTRETTQQAGEATAGLLEAVGRNLGYDNLKWEVGDVLFKCDGCKRTQPFEDSREGWEHRRGDDFCPACVASEDDGEGS